jgi:uncharacterized membrane protein YphA (DoxX/SURF4 family)
MALSRRFARPLLASIFVVGGWDAFWNPAGKAKKAKAVTEPLVESAGVEGVDTETLVRINGAVQVGAGALLALGKFRRLAALALIGSIVPTTYAGHRFWEETDPATRSQQKMHFLKNIGLLGGLILAAFDTEGEPSLAWRAKRQARQLESVVASTTHRKAHGAGEGIGPAVTQATTAAKQTVRRGRAASRHARRRLGTAGADLSHKIAPGPEILSQAQEVFTDAVKESSETAAHVAQQVASFVADAAHELEPLSRNGSHPRVDAIVPLIASGAERTSEVFSKLREHIPSD